MREIITTFDNGKVTVETKGFKGSDCLKETMALEKALGTVVDSTKTPEYYQSQDATQTQTRSQR